MHALLALVALPALLCPQDRNAAAAVRSFDKAFFGTARTTRTVEERTAALELLAGHDSARVAEALADAGRAVLLDLDELDKERQSANAEMVELLRGKEFDEKRSLPLPQYERYQQLKAMVADLRARSDAVRALALEVRKRIRKLEDPDSLKWLLRKVVGNKKYALPLQLCAARAVGVGSSEMLDDMVQALRRARQPEAVVALLDGIGLCKSNARDHAGQLLSFLEHEDAAVRERAALALSSIAVPDAIEPMIRLLQREQGQARKRIVAALEVLTREQFGDNPGAWQAWWKAEGAALLAGEHELGGGRPSSHQETNQKNYYFGIPQDGEAIVYVIDSSGSMKKEVDFDLGHTVSAGSATTRLEACKAELIRALGRLRKDQKFNVVWYNDLPHIFRPAMLPVSDEVVAAAQDWVRKLQPASSTNIHDALEMGFGLTGRGSRDKYYGIEVDTMFLLTDGSPTKPDGTLDSTEKILLAVRSWNPLKRVVIHCIGIGKGLNEPFLQQLASENGGEFKRY